METEACCFPFIRAWQGKNAKYLGSPIVARKDKPLEERQANVRLHDLKTNLEGKRPAPCAPFEVEWKAGSVWLGSHLIVQRRSDDSTVMLITKTGLLEAKIPEAQWNMAAELPHLKISIVEDEDEVAEAVKEI